MRHVDARLLDLNQAGAGRDCIEWQPSLPSSAHANASYPRCSPLAAVGKLFRIPLSFIAQSRTDRLASAVPGVQRRQRQRRAGATARQPGDVLASRLHRSACAAPASGYAGRVTARCGRGSGCLRSHGSVSADRSFVRASSLSGTASVRGHRGAPRSPAAAARCRFCSGLPA